MYTPVLDPAVIEKLREVEMQGSPGLLGDLQAIFRRTAAAQLVEIERALFAGDPAALQGAAHSLKSTCGNLGAHPMVELCLEIERSVKAGELGRVMGCLRRLEALYVAADVELGSHVSRLDQRK